MTLKESVLSEFDAEMAATRRLLERVPDAALGWKPHEKSMSMGGLATHLAQLPHWGAAILQGEAYDIVLDATPHATELASTRDVLAAFDRHVNEVRRALVDGTDAHLAAPWALKRDGDTMMSLPRLSAFRRMLVNHLIHHRGQLTVYLRMQNVPLPPLYGPTADEGM